MHTTSDPKAGKTKSKTPPPQEAPAVPGGPKARARAEAPPKAKAKAAKAAAESPTSQRKIEANRANAKKSTGPKTAAGKARSAQNAVKHRLTSRRFWLADEERMDYLARLEGLYDEFRPLSEGEARLVDLAAMSLWRLFRVPAMEAELLEQARTGPAGEDLGLGAAFQQQELTLGRLARYAANLQREMTRALAELRRVQAARRAAQRRALRGEDEWAPADFPVPFTAEGAENAEGGAWGMRNGAGGLTAEAAEGAEEEARGAADERVPGVRKEANARTPENAEGAEGGARGFTAAGAEGAENAEGGARGARNEATASVTARRVSATGFGSPAAGRQLSPEWHGYLHAEAERLRALAAQGLEGAPVPPLPAPHGARG